METRLKALDMGAKDFLEKPFDRLEAMTRIQNMLEVRLLHNEVRNQNRVLEERVKERTIDLINTQREILRRLGKASEYRDDDTGFHINRMSQYCQLIAKSADMSDRFSDMILDISAMHDIGKIGIPDSILLKPDKLNNDEFEIMKTHTIIGADILSGSDSPILRLAESIALTHHERWDGSGYPNGLAGESIPIEGRICALADVFDALTSIRPYKSAWSVENAVAEMEKGRGSHFDPKLFDVFIKVLPQIVEIKDKYPNEVLCAHA
jgi:putative two-component system response regulator